MEDMSEISMPPSPLDKWALVLNYGKDVIVARGAEKDLCSSEWSTMEKDLAGMFSLQAIY